MVLLKTLTKVVLATLLLSRVLLGAPQQPAAKKPNAVETLALAIQKQYNNTKSATFDFEQSYKHPFLNIAESSKGHVSYIQASGKMVWSYLEPKDKQKKFFIDGKKFTYYSVSDKTAFTHDCYDKDTLSASVAFLLGKGDLKQSFTLEALQGASPNKALSWLVLNPKEKDAPIKKIFLGVNKASKVEESIVEDPSGGKNHFKFIKFVTNPTIDQKTFIFTPPKGVMVQKMPHVSCPAPPPSPKQKTKPDVKKAPNLR